MSGSSAEPTNRNRHEMAPAPGRAGLPADEIIPVAHRDRATGSGIRDRLMTREVHIALHEGSRADLRPLFELAEDSAVQLDAYLGSGRVLVAIQNGQVVGHLQLTETAVRTELEIKNMAILEAHRRSGIGSALIVRAIALGREESRERLLVATAAADLENLAFYQRLGFRMLCIERDAFTPATGYAKGITGDGIELRDRVWLDMPLGST